MNKDIVSALENDTQDKRNLEDLNLRQESTRTNKTHLIPTLQLKQHDLFNQFTPTTQIKQIHNIDEIISQASPAMRAPQLMPHL